MLRPHYRYRANVVDLSWQQTGQLQAVLLGSYELQLVSNATLPILCPGRFTQSNARSSIGFEVFQRRLGMA